MEKIGFGGGCHWCTEAVFQALKGVKKVEQGWISSTGDHDAFSEAVIVHFHPATIDLTTLIAIHLHTHSCTSEHAMRKKYRSAVYPFSDEQAATVGTIIKNLQADFQQPIITQCLPFVAFKENEETFQNYYFKNPEKVFCTTYIDPKLKLLMDQFSKYLDYNKLSHLAVPEQKE